jgi:hypothetical protein
MRIRRVVSWQWLTMLSFYYFDPEFLKELFVNVNATSEALQSSDTVQFWQLQPLRSHHLKAA